MVEIFGLQLDSFVMMLGALALVVIVALYYFLIRGKAENNATQPQA
jgi:heme/copper-type cytochrome/quinol oxidase subunit 2